MIAMESSLCFVSDSTANYGIDDRKEKGDSNEICLQDEPAGD